MWIRPNMQEAPERLNKTLCVVRVLFAMFRNRTWLFWNLPISVRKSTNIGLQVLIVQCLLIEKQEKQDAGMLASNANSSSPTLSHALQQVKAARLGVICQGVSIAPHFLRARLQGCSFQFVFQLVFPAYTLQLPSICVLPTAFKTFCWNKLGIRTGTSWHLSNISSDISAPWAHESTSLDINKAKGMLTSKPKRIFSDNVTCFGTKRDWSRVLQVLLTACFQGCKGTAFNLFSN